MLKYHHFIYSGGHLYFTSHLPPSSVNLEKRNIDDILLNISPVFGLAPALSIKTFSLSQQLNELKHSDSFRIIQKI